MPANMSGGARLRFVTEDPAQLLSNAVASYIIDHLCANGNQPTTRTLPIQRDGMRHNGSSEVAAQGVPVVCCLGLQSVRLDSTILEANK